MTAVTDDAGEAAADGRSASETVFSGIIRALEARQLVPGQRLVEVDLTATFGVSRNSVREALQRLAAEGIVELLRHKGAAIRLLSVEETLDVLDVAERITGLLACAAARAVAKGARGTPLADAIRRLVESDGAGDTEGFARARRNYYRALLALANSRELRRLFPAVQMPIVYAQYRLPGLQQIRLQDYRVIAREVLAGDEEAADLAAMAHVRNVREEILQRAAQPAPATIAPRRDGDAARRSASRA
jgi:DNA-binding GntR family transcriptional regulator